jgi:transposase
MPPHPDGQLFLPFGQESIREETPDIKPIVEEIQVEAHKHRTNLKENQKKAIRQEIPSKIERRVQIVEPSGINTEEMVKTGEDVREILQYTPGNFYADRIVRPLYRENDPSVEAVSTPIFQAEAVESFIPKSFAGNTAFNASHRK